MNIYEKLANARYELKSKGLTMSGNNKYAGYSYFDLSDILPVVTELELKYKILSVVRYGVEMATLTLYDAEKPEEFIEFTSPMSTAELKGCHAVQNLGAVETYVRRYLYLAAYEIVETETLDKMQGADDTRRRKEKTPREKLIDKLKASGINIKAYAAEKGLDENTPPERYEELLKEFNG